MPKNRLSRSALLLVIGSIAISAATSRAAAEAARFQGLGDLPGRVTDSVGYGISGDGRVGIAAGSSGAFRWIDGVGPSGIGGDVTPQGISQDGSVVVGWGHSPGSPTLRPFRWEQATGLQFLGDASTNASFGGAHGVSADGSVMVGYINIGQIIEAFRWTRAEGIVMMGDLPGSPPPGAFAFGSQAMAVTNTAQGLVIVGGGGSDNGNEAFRWTAATGMVPLGDLPGGTFESSANDVTPDGRVIVGVGNSAGGLEAFRWTQDGGMVGLGELPGGEFNSYADAVSADGSVVSGRSRGPTNFEAFVWDETHGMRSLKQALAEAGVSTTGWTLHEAWVSDDGRRFVGTGINPRGQAEAFFAVLPEPGGATILITALAPMLARRRR